MTPKSIKTVYRYRQINEKTLDTLAHDKVYFAHPASFNDPLDCKPTIESDSSNDDLRELLRILVTTRIERETEHLLKKAKLKSEKAREFARKRASIEASRELSDIEYNANDPEYCDITNIQEHLLRYQIEKEILKHYERGVCCFSSSYNNPVLWSHYGDQHRGICIVYDSDRLPKPIINLVDYGGERNIKTSLIFDAVVKKSSTALEALEKSILLRKAKEWKYEKEWRMIGEIGESDSPLRMREIIFGVRCSASMKLMIVRAMEDRLEKLKFSEMQYVAGSYKLKKKQMDGEDVAFLPYTALSATEAFEELEPLTTPQNSPISGSA